MFSLQFRLHNFSFNSICLITDDLYPRTITPMVCDGDRMGILQTNFSNIIQISSLIDDL
jgi:hypothetical protein